jgi:hypothetical protein
MGPRLLLLLRQLRPLQRSDSCGTRAAVKTSPSSQFGSCGQFGSNSRRFRLCSENVAHRRLQCELPTPSCQMLLPFAKWSMWSVAKHSVYQAHERFDIEQKTPSPPLQPFGHSPSKAVSTTRWNKNSSDPMLTRA